MENLHKEDRKYDENLTFDKCQLNSSGGRCQDRLRSAAILLETMPVKGSGLGNKSLGYYIDLKPVKREEEGR